MYREQVKINKELAQDFREYKREHREDMERLIGKYDKMKSSLRDTVDELDEISHKHEIAVAHSEVCDEALAEIRVEHDALKQLIKAEDKV